MKVTHNAAHSFFVGLSKPPTSTEHLQKTEDCETIVWRKWHSSLTKHKEILLGIGDIVFSVVKWNGILCNSHRKPALQLLKRCERSTSWWWYLCVFKVFPRCPPVSLNPRTVYNHMDAVMMCSDRDPDPPNILNVKVMFFATVIHGEVSVLPSDLWTLLHISAQKTASVTGKII